MLVSDVCNFHHLYAMNITYQECLLSCLVATQKHKSSTSHENKCFMYVLHALIKFLEAGVKLHHIAN